MNARRLLMRIVGIALIVAGIAGLIFCAAGLVFLVRIEQQVETSLTEQLEGIDGALTVTANGLSVAETSLEKATEAVVSLEETMVRLGETVGHSAPLLDIATNVIGKELPEAIESTQETLAAVADSAKLVDDILTLVTSIRLLGLEAYRPDVQLNEGVLTVAKSLDRMPGLLSTAQDGLDTAKDDLQEVEGDFATMAENIGAIATDLEDAQSVLVQYREIVSDLQDMVSSARQSLPTWLRMFQIGMSLILIWLGVAQLGLLAQGWDLIGRSRASRAAEPATEKGKS